TMGEKSSFLIDEITRFDSAINILKYANDLGELELTRDSLHDNYNSTYILLQSKYKKYGKDIFEPITTRWKLPKKKNTTFLNYGFDKPLFTSSTKPKPTERDKILEKLIKKNGKCEKGESCLDTFKKFEFGL